MNNVTVPGGDVVVHRAVGTVLAELSWRADLEEALAAAHRQMHRPGRPAMHNRMACTAAVDLHDDGSMLAAIAGDCEVWYRQGPTWTQVPAPPLLSEAGVRMWAARPAESGDVQWRWASSAMATPDLWTAPALGVFPTPTMSVHQLPADVTGVVVATDGLELTPDVASDLHRHVAHLQGRPVPDGHPNPHGDLAAVSVTW